MLCSSNSSLQIDYDKAIELKKIRISFFKMKSNLVKLMYSFVIMSYNSQINVELYNNTTSPHRRSKVTSTKVTPSCAPCQTRVRRPCPTHRSAGYTPYAARLTTPSKSMRTFSLKCLRYMSVSVCLRECVCVCLFMCVCLFLKTIVLCIVYLCICLGLLYLLARTCFEQEYGNILTQVSQRYVCVFVWVCGCVFVSMCVNMYFFYAFFVKIKLKQS